MKCVTCSIAISFLVCGSLVAQSETNAVMGHLGYGATVSAEDDDQNTNFVLPGLQATTIGTSRVIDAGVTVKPGDRVDILATHHDARNRADVTKVLMTNVLVLGLYEKRADPSHTGEDSITLAVPTEQAALVAAAGKAGALRIVLPHVDEKAVGASRPPVGDFWLPGEFQRLLEERKREQKTN
jgi:Flp pilus assembly protein CpaB